VKTKTDSDAFERYKQEHARYLGIAAEQLRTEKGLTRIESRSAPMSLSYGFKGWRAINSTQTTRSVGWTSLLGP
jgi:hypothetical protein